MYYGKKRKNEVKEFILKNLFVLGMVSLFSSVIIGYFATLSVRMKNFTVDRTFYFLSVKVQAETAAVVAKSEYSDGGAGYTFVHDGQDYVALAGYNTEREAQIVSDSLKTRGRETEIVSLTVDTFYFTDRKEVEAFEGVYGFVHTVLQCIDLLYETANELDEGGFTQEEARRVLKEICGVIAQAGEGGVTRVTELTRASVNKCTEIVNGVIYAKDVRYTQLLLSEGIYDLQELFEL